MRTALQTHPKVVRIMSAMRTDRLHVIGALHAVWTIFDQHSEDGILLGYSLDSLDTMIGFPGFSAAMKGVNWLDSDGDGIKMPEFSTHNGKSAKRRATESDRKRVSRESAQSVGNPSALDADKKRSRKEKKRDIPPISPKGGRFGEFWSAWPANQRKVGRATCEKKWGARNLDSLADTIIAHVKAMRGTEQWKQFAPAPLTYLNQSRWEDGMPAGPGNAGGSWKDDETRIADKAKEYDVDIKGMTRILAINAIENAMVDRNAGRRAQR